MMKRVTKPEREPGRSAMPQQSQFASRPLAPKAEEHEAPVGEPRVGFSLADIDLFPRETVQTKLRQGSVGDRYEQEANELSSQGSFGQSALAAERMRDRSVPNRTGLPDRLKAGIESLSGIDMSDVRVHGDSDKPAQLNALAYTQGNQIHLGPGQTKHLPHEAWHVVQQKQGRVRPTMRINGVGINDDQSLENEADMMKAKHFVPSLYEEILRKREKKDWQKASHVDVAQCVGRATLEEKMEAYRKNWRDFENAKDWASSQPSESRKFYLGPRDTTFRIHGMPRTRLPGPTRGYITNRTAFNPRWTVRANDAMIEGLLDANTRFRIASNQGKQIEKFLRINNIRNSDDLFRVLYEKCSLGQCPMWALSTDRRDFSVTMREIGILLDEGYTPQISDRKPGRAAIKGKKLTFIPPP